MKNRIVVPSVAALLLALSLPASPAFGWSAGPLDLMTNAPGEGVCTICHNSFALDSGVGSVTLVLPEDYVPGATHVIEVVLADPDAMSWGFELTVLDEALEGAGLVKEADENTQTSVTNMRRYIKHTSAGTAFGQTGMNSWSFDWEAPEEDVGPVTFYVAGSAANGNLNNQGDRIYSNSDTIPAPEPTGIALRSAALLLLASLRAGLRRRS